MVNGLPWLCLPADGFICLRSSPAQRRRRMLIHEPPPVRHAAPEGETMGIRPAGHIFIKAM
jgi:hypothetical protein